MVTREHFFGRLAEEVASIKRNIILLSQLRYFVPISILIFTAIIRQVESFHGPRRKTILTGRTWPYIQRRSHLTSFSLYSHNKQSYNCSHERMIRSIPASRRLSYRRYQQRLDMFWKPLQSNFGSIFRCTSGITESRTTTTIPTTTTQLQVHHNIRDADVVEMLVGGERYSLVPMPEKMKATTVYVGNLCEFVQDRDLSSYFSQVSTLTTVPSCVVRKVDTQSMGYGFVSFPNVQEKEAAIRKFHHSEWKGKRIKVEAIDKEIVRIPEYMVEYVYGPISKTQKSRFYRNDKVKGDVDLIVPVQRISKDDVERLSRGQPAKRRGYGSRNVPHRLNDEERDEYDRATLTKGYLTLSGNGNRRARKGSPLKNIHRQWCDARDCPQILLYKAVGGNTVDEVIIDLSPLRLHGLFDKQELVEDYLARWKAQILSASYESGMELLDSNNNQECDLTASSFLQTNDFDDDADHIGDDIDCVDEIKIGKASTLSQPATLDQKLWATYPIWQLPVVSLGTFVGERSKAKTMASNLAKLWTIPESIAMHNIASDIEYQNGKSSLITRNDGPLKSRRDAGAKKGGHTKTKGLQEHRKRGGGHRQAW